MANGRSLHDAIRARIPYAAMWDVPFGTRMRVCAVETGVCRKVVITDRGPARSLERLIDLNPETFHDLCGLPAGLCKVRAEVLP